MLNGKVPLVKGKIEYFDFSLHDCILYSCKVRGYKIDVEKEDTVGGPFQRNRQPNVSKV